MPLRKGDFVTVNIPCIYYGTTYAANGQRLAEVEIATGEGVVMLVPLSSIVINNDEKARKEMRPTRRNRK